MAQSDWDFNATGAGTLRGGNQGTARLNSSLSSPLTGHGDYCREYGHPATGAVAMSATLKSSVNSGQFFEIPSTQSISVRASLRHTNVGAGSYSIGIVGKAFAGAPGSLEAPRGYSVMIGDTAQTGASSDIRFLADAGGTVLVETIGVTATNDTWFRVRLDIVPISTSEDVIRVYTGTGAPDSETWNLEYTKNILSSDAYYIPWSDTGNGKVGYWTVLASTGAQIMHIDSFRAFTETV